MRWSLFFLISIFILLSAYVGWKQGAFDFKREKMALTETVTPADRKETADEKAIAHMYAKLKEPLKSELVDLIKERKWDEAAALYEDKKGSTADVRIYGLLLKLAQETGKQGQE